MHAHRIEVLDRADDDAIVLLVPHHLHLELFPAEHGFLDQDFVGGGGVKAALDDVDEFFLVVGDAAAGAAHGEGRADDRGQADLGQCHQRLSERIFLVALAAVAFAERPLPLELFERCTGRLGALGLILVAEGLLQFGRIGQTRLRRLESDLGHGLAEQLAVFGLVDGIGRRADHLDVELVQRALPAQRQRAVQRGLSAHGRQQREAAGNDVTFLLDDFCDDLGRDRLDIGRIRQFRVGHDRGRIGIDEDDAVALFLQRLHRLRAGIVELAGLADHDGTGADDQDGRDVGSFRHHRSRAGIRAQKKGALAARPLVRERGVFPRARVGLRPVFGAAKPRKTPHQPAILTGFGRACQPRARCTRSAIVTLAPPTQPRSDGLHAASTAPPKAPPIAKPRYMAEALMESATIEACGSIRIMLAIWAG